MSDAANPMLSPSITKVTVNIGVGEGGRRLQLAERVLEVLTTMKPMRTISAKANQLNQYHVHTGDTDYISKDLARFMGVTPQSITTAAKGLGKGRIVLHIGPADEDTSTEEPATEKEGK